MFMPQSQPHHGRSYGAPSTVRRRGDKENAGALPSKTPSRNALKQVAGPSTGRMLGKTIDRNVLAPKSDAPPPNDDIKPKRLFANVQAPPSTTRPVKPRSVKTPAHAKTPAPYRDVEPEPQPTPLPSAQRMRRRSRNSLVRTPEHQWDQELSLDSIAEVELEPAAAPSPESDYELEYAPSPVKDVPYVPEWADSIPDPIETMKKLGSMRPMLFTAAPSPPKALEPVPMPTLELCDDDELEEPILRKVKPAQVATKPKAAPTAKPASRTLGIRGPGGAARPGMSAARPPARPLAASSKPSASKPAAATSATRPATARTAPPVRAGAPTKPATSTSRPAPLGATRSVAAPRPAPTNTRIAPTATKTGVRGVASKTEGRPSATRPASATSVRKPATAAQTVQPSSRLGGKLALATRPAPASKAVKRAAAPAPARAPAAARPPSSPVPVFADLDADFGVLDLNFDELEPKPEAAPLVEADSGLIELPLPATAPEQASEAKVSAAPSPDPAQASEQPVTMEASGPSVANIAVPEANEHPVSMGVIKPSVTEAAVSESSEQPTSADLPTPVVAQEPIEEDDFEPVDATLAPIAPSSSLIFDSIPEENELDVSEDMSLESI